LWWLLPIVKIIYFGARPGLDLNLMWAERRLQCSWLTMNDVIWQCCHSLGFLPRSWFFIWSWNMVFFMKTLGFSNIIYYILCYNQFSAAEKHLPWIFLVFYCFILGFSILYSNNTDIGEYLRRRALNRAAALRTDWIDDRWTLGRPTRRELQWSILEQTTAWTMNVIVLGSPKFFLPGPHWRLLRARQAKRAKSSNYQIWWINKRLFIPKLWCKTTIVRVSFCNKWEWWWAMVFTTVRYMKLIRLYVQCLSLSSHVWIFGKHHRSDF